MGEHGWPTCAMRTDTVAWFLANDHAFDHPEELPWALIREHYEFTWLEVCKAYEILLDEYHSDMSNSDETPPSESD